MNKLKSIIMGIALMVPLISLADGSPWLTFTLSDDSEISVNAENLTINYANRVLQLKSETVDRVFPIEDLKSMRFSSVMSGIDLVATDDSYAYIELYDLSGGFAGRFGSIEEARATLTSGIYIIKDSNKNHKVVF